MNESEQNQIPWGPSEEDIAICAYLVWEQEGRPEGQDKVHWEQAEEQLTASYAHNRWCLFLPPTNSNYLSGGTVQNK